MGVMGVFAHIESIRVIWLRSVLTLGFNEDDCVVSEIPPVHCFWFLRYLISAKRPSDELSWLHNIAGATQATPVLKADMSLHSAHTQLSHTQKFQ